ncbi:unnamed protein product [Amoebophrya sp. A25]|nr:unnamed protein product [Amoebophrya sp. A25]|eukprot:GSA25T00014719001.1
MGIPIFETWCFTARSNPRDDHSQKLVCSRPPLKLFQNRLFLLPVGDGVVYQAIYFKASCWSLLDHLFVRKVSGSAGPFISKVVLPCCSCWTTLGDHFRKF